MFPTTDNSQTIVDCLYQSATQLGVKILSARTPMERGYRVDKIEKPLLPNDCFKIHTDEKTFEANRILISTGSATAVWTMLEEMGHRIVKPVPSLFTFNIKDKRLLDLAGLSVPMAEVKVLDTHLKASGPLLITHWGVSGPAILRLSAWGARILFDKNYQFKISINWTGFENQELVKDYLNDCKSTFYKKQINTTPKYNLPSRLWVRMIEAAQIPLDIKWADISKKQIQNLAEQITQSIFEVNGKSTFKEEFVTAGGVHLDDVNFKTFESKIIPNLYFAGEVLDIDAITGGFNFQAAWTGGWIAGEAIAKL